MSLREILKNLTEEHILTAIEKYGDDLQNFTKCDYYAIRVKSTGKIYQVKKTMQYANNKPQCLNNSEKLGSNNTQKNHYTASPYRKVFKEKFNSPSSQIELIPLEENSQKKNICDKKNNKQAENNENEVTKILPDFKTAKKIFNKFIDYSSVCDNEKGVYAIFLKEEKKEEFLNLFKDECKRHIENRLNELKNNLIYIGKTEKKTFKERVINQHLKGKINNSTFCRTMLKFLSEPKIQPELKNLFNKHLSIKVLPLEKCSTISCTESVLIYHFQPPFNNEGCEEFPV